MPYKWRIFADPQDAQKFLDAGRAMRMLSVVYCTLDLVKDTPEEGPTTYLARLRVKVMKTNQVLLEQIFRYPSLQDVIVAFGESPDVGGWQVLDNMPGE